MNRASYGKWPLGSKKGKEDVEFYFAPEADECVRECKDRFGQIKEMHLPIKTEVQEVENGYLLSIKGQVVQLEPKFELQPSIDAQNGVCALIDLPKCNEILSVYQHKCWWTRPAFPHSFSEVPANSQLVLLKYEEYYICALAVCSEVYRCDIEGTAKGLLVRLSSNCGGINNIDALAVSVAYAEDPYFCIHTAGVNAMRALGHCEMLRENRTFPSVFEKLGWCSWDAFYHKVSEEGLIQKAAEFKEKTIPVGWMLIDDGWSDADLDTQTLIGIDASKEKFPNGLNATVDRLKKEFQISHVGVWHAVMGYWNGLQKDSEADAFFAGTTTKLPDGRVIPKSDSGSSFDFYDRWHQYLNSRCGIDFIKVDGQSSISIFYSGLESYGKASDGIQKGLNASAALHFDNAIINCMGMGAEDVWHRPSSMITRTSDDFVPNVKHGFREHAIQNAYTSLWSGLFYVGDWDMFFSRHPENRQNSILRAISGGPVYTSDKVGESDLKIIQPLVLHDGTVLRCDDVGLPTKDCLFKDPTKERVALKIFNRKKEAWYIAVFNIREDDEKAEGEIELADIPGIAEGSYLLYDEWNHCCKKISAGVSYQFSLDSGQAAIYEIVRHKSIQVFGIRGKYIISGTVEVLAEDIHRVVVRVLEGGNLICSSDYALEATCLDNGETLQQIQDGSIVEFHGCKVGEIVQISARSA